MDSNKKRMMLADAIVNQHFKLAKILVEGGVDVNAFTSGLTPLMEASLLPSLANCDKKFQLLLLLLEYGADLNVKDTFGRTCLHYAYMCGCQRVIRLLQSRRRMDVLRCCFKF